MRNIAGVIATVGAPGTIENPRKSGPPKNFDPIPNIAGDGQRMKSFFDRVLPKDGNTIFPFRVMEEPSSGDLLKALAEEVSHVGDGDLFVMVLSGHGFSVPLPNPGQADLPGLHEDDRELFVASDTYVPANELREVFATKGEGLTVLQIIDACSGDGIAERFDMSRFGFSSRRVSVFDEIQDSAFRTHRADAPTRIKIAAAREYSEAVALETKGEFRGALISAVIAAWGDDPQSDSPESYDAWLIKAMRGVVTAASQSHFKVGLPVVRSIGAAPRRVYQRPFTLPGAPPDPE